MASGNAEALPWAELPFSSALAPLLGTLFYMSLHVVLGRLITEENKLQLTPLMAAYNFALAASSAVLFGALTWSVWGVYSEYGFEGVWNDPNVRVCVGGWFGRRCVCVWVGKEGWIGGLVRKRSLVRRGAMHDVGARCTRDAGARERA